MTNNDEFTQNERRVKELRNKALILSPGSNIEDYFHPHFSSHELRRLGLPHKQLATSFELCAMAADLTRKINNRNKTQEAELIRQIIQQTSKSVVLFKSEYNDPTDTLKYILYRYADYFGMVGLDPERIKRAFACKDLYFYLSESRTHERNHEYWERLIDTFSEYACDSPAGEERTKSK